jgi:hypothetical protein
MENPSRVLPPSVKDFAMRRIVEFIDWAARIHFLGTVAWGGGGWAVTFFGASAYGWDPISVWVASVVVGACCALIFIGYKAHRYPAFPQGTNWREQAPSLPEMAALQSRTEAIKGAVKIIFGTGHPFESVAPAGKNKNRTVRVKIENNTDAEISNGTVNILNLDPPQKEHRNFFLKGDITIGPHRHTFVDVAYYSEGTSEAPPGPSFRLCVPIPSGFIFDTLPGTLPLRPHNFHLRFSSLEDHTLDEVYCRLSVDQTHILHLENWGDSTKTHARSADLAIIELRWKPGGANDPYEVNAIVTPSLTIKDFVLIARFATAVHYANGNSKWLWQPSVRITGPRDLFREETVQTPLIRCPRSAGGANEMIFFDNKTWKIEDSQLILLRLSAVCDGHTINLQKAFHQRRFGETVVLDTIPLEDIAYIEGAEAAT